MIIIIKIITVTIIIKNMRVIDTDEFIVNSWQFCFTNLGLDLSKQIKHSRFFRWLWQI